MKYAFWFFFLILTACGPTGTKQLANLQGNSNQQTSANTLPVEYDATACKLSKLGLNSSLGSPQNINQIVDLINALPKPVSIPCFIQALNRPLKINATSSILSVQPAVGIENPRVFIFFDKLVLSVASAGDGKDLLEFSYMYSDTSSLKGELLFPVNSALSYSAPFVKVETGGQSSCSGCHINEVLDTSVTGTAAYISIALKPDPSRKVNLNDFYQQSYLCDFNNDKSYRCQVIRSIFENGTIMETSFPSRTQTYFQSLGF